jgi:hypothetical protein
MPHSDAYEQFQKSTIMDHEKWHDGIGYDLDAFKRMSADEQTQVVDQIRRKSDKDWRDAELLEFVGADPKHANDADKTLREMADSESIDLPAQLRAIEALIDAGKLDDVDRRLAAALGQAESFNGLDAALSLAGEHPGPLVKIALVQGVRDRPGEVGVNYAAMLYFLAGITKEEFDWDMRPFFLHFADDTPKAEHDAAFAELCQRLQVDPKSIP